MQRACSKNMLSVFKDSEDACVAGAEGMRAQIGGGDGREVTRTNGAGPCEPREDLGFYSE